MINDNNNCAVGLFLLMWKVHIKVTNISKLVQMIFNIWFWYFDYLGSISCTLHNVYSQMIFPFDCYQLQPVGLAVHHYSEWKYIHHFGHVWSFVLSLQSTQIIFFIASELHFYLVCIYPNSLLQEGCDTKSIFKQSKLVWIQSFSSSRLVA